MDHLDRLGPFELRPGQPPVETPEKAVIEQIESIIKFAENSLKNPSFPPGSYRMLVGRIRSTLAKIYGKSNNVLNSLPTPGEVNLNSENAKKATIILKNRLEELISGFNRIGEITFSPKLGKVFIGHGRSPDWLYLKEFLSERLSLKYNEFNSDPTAGYPTFERISQMLDESSYAFLVMTAEDEHSDKRFYARPNVIHEIGLFQGRLGPKRAIILMEDGCEEFSNIIGLTQLRYPKGHIKATFEDIRRVLEREGMIAQ